MFKMQLTIPQWLELPQAVKQRFKQYFNIPRSSGSQIVDSRLVSDGHTHEDLAHISVESMQVFLSSKETDFWRLFETLLEKIEAELSAEAKTVTEDSDAEYQAKAIELEKTLKKAEALSNEIMQVPRRRGRPKKSA